MCVCSHAAPLQIYVETGQTAAHKLADIKTQTSAAFRPVVLIPSWAMVTLVGSHRVRAFAFVVTAAVFHRALVGVQR